MWMVSLCFNDMVNVQTHPKLFISRPVPADRTDWSDRPITTLRKCKSILSQKHSSTPIHGGLGLKPDNLYMYQIGWFDDDIIDRYIKTTAILYNYYKFEKKLKPKLQRDERN